MIGAEKQSGSRVTKLDMLALGLGDLGYSIVSSTVAIYIVSFGTMALPGLAANFAALMGIAFGIAVMFDAISDPIMGFISDHFRSKTFGKRHLFMLLGLTGMMACAVAVWYVPYETLGAWGTFAWFAFFLILLRTFNTMYFTPVGAFSVEISTDYDERTIIQAVRSVFYIVGMLLPVVIMGAFQNRYAGYYDVAGKLIIPTKDVISDPARQAGLAGLEFRKGQQVAQGYKDFSWVGTAICFATSAFFLLVTRRYVRILRLREEAEAAERGVDLSAPREKFTMAQCRRELIDEGHDPRKLRNIAVRMRLRRKRGDAGQVTLGAVLRNFFGTFKLKEMRVIAFGYVVAMMSASLVISLGFNVFTFTFNLKTAQMYVLMGLLLLMTIGCQPLWTVLAKKKSKQFSMLAGLIISFVGFACLLIAFFCRERINTILAGDLSWLGAAIFVPSIMIAGAGTGVLYSMPLALIGDVAVVERDRTGLDKTGTYAGVMTFCYKAGQGIVTAISTSLLSAVGFVAGQATQSRRASDGIGWILFVGAVAFIAFGIIIFANLKLDKGKISEILSRQRAIADRVADSPFASESASPAEVSGDPSEGDASADRADRA